MKFNSYNIFILILIWKDMKLFLIGTLLALASSLKIEREHQAYGCDFATKCPTGMTCVLFAPGAGMCKWKMIDSFHQIYHQFILNFWNWDQNINSQNFSKILSHQLFSNNQILKIKMRKLPLKRLPNSEDFLWCYHQGLW